MASPAKICNCNLNVIATGTRQADQDGRARAMPKTRPQSQQRLTEAAPIHLWRH